MADIIKFLKIVQGEIKSIDEVNKTVEVIVSTESKDSDGDIILCTAFSKNMKRYKSNPILLNSHNYRDVECILGKAINIKSTDKGLLVKFQYFVGQGNSAADWAFQLAKNGIAAFSIGFASLDFEWIKEKTSDGCDHITGRKFKEIELLEISQVTVPANKDAVLQSRSLKSTEIELLNKIDKAFTNKEIEEIKNLNSEENSDNTQINKTKENINTQTSIYEEVLLGGEESEQSSTDQEPKNNKPSEKKGHCIKVNSLDIKKITEETLR